MRSVTRVTANATLDDLSVQDYREIYEELRQTLSLDKLVAQLGSAFSKATWSKYEARKLDLNRTMRSELRRGVGLPELPKTVADAVAESTSPDAAVWKVGDGVAETVVMVAGTSVALTVNSEGEVTEGHVTAVTRPVRGDTTRRRVIRPVASQGQNAQRLALSASWSEVIDAGLAAIERRKSRSKAVNVHRIEPGSNSVNVHRISSDAGLPA